MQIRQENNTRRVTIDPGEHYVTRRNETISTLLGSCVSACLYDPVSRVAGMNHFLLARRRNGLKTSLIESDAGRYGIHAMELLINDLLAHGAKRANLRAKAFGGADVLHQHRSGETDRFNIGELNGRFVVEFLAREQIPLVATDLGGRHGRVIHFRAADQSVFMRPISQQLESRVEAEERRYLKQRIDEQEEAAGKVQFW